LYKFQDWKGYISSLYNDITIEHYKFLIQACLLIVLFFITLDRAWIFYELKVCSNPAFSKLISAIFPSLWSLCIDWKFFQYFKLFFIIIIIFAMVFSEQWAWFYCGFGLSKTLPIQNDILINKFCVCSELLWWPAIVLFLFFSSRLPILFPETQ
jgi:hypothetical protein